MDAEPFAVVTCCRGDVWIGWLWEQPFYSAHGDTKDAVVARLKARLDAELDRRERIDSQYKFRPGRWPTHRESGPDGRPLPSLSDLHERVLKDAQRRRLPLQDRTLEDWRQAFPYKAPSAHLPLDSDDAALIDATRPWSEMIAKDDFESAFAVYPHAESLLPRTDFPVANFVMTADCLRKYYQRDGISFPTAVATDPRAAIVDRCQVQPENEFTWIAQKLVCRLGAMVARVELPIRIATSQQDRGAIFDVFEMDDGLLVTFRNAT